MTKLTENLKRMLNALAYAHAAENLSLSAKGRYLSKSIAADLGASSQAATSSRVPGTATTSARAS